MSSFSTSSVFRGTHFVRAARLIVPRHHHQNNNNMEPRAPAGVAPEQLVAAVAATADVSNQQPVFTSNMMIDSDGKILEGQRRFRALRRKKQRTQVNHISISISI